MDMIKEYVEEIQFETCDGLDIKKEDLEGLEKQKGFVVETETTDLWIYREVTVVSFLNIPTVMESVEVFVVMDDFGMVMWKGSSEETKEFIEGFVENKEEDG